MFQPYTGMSNCVNRALSFSQKRTENLLSTWGFMHKLENQYIKSIRSFSLTKGGISSLVTPSSSRPPALPLMLFLEEGSHAPGALFQCSFWTIREGGIQGSNVFPSQKQQLLLFSVKGVRS